MSPSFVSIRPVYISSLNFPLERYIASDDKKLQSRRVQTVECQTRDGGVRGREATYSQPCPFTAIGHVLRCWEVREESLDVGVWVREKNKEQFCWAETKLVSIFLGFLFLSLLVFWVLSPQALCQLIYSSERPKRKRSKQLHRNRVIG